MKTLTAFCLSLYIVFSGSSALAYSFKTSDAGHTLRWASGPIEYQLHNNLPPYLSQSAVLEAVRASFASWQQVPTAELELVYGGYTEQLPGFDPTNAQKNQNVVHFVTAGWEHGDDVLAVTTTIYRKSSNEIVDSDVMINAVNFRWSTSDDAVYTDLQNALTHEVGHFLGLAHSDDPSATMYGRHAAHETLKRTLALDDVEGISALYPRLDATVTTADEFAPRLDSPLQVQLIKASTRADAPLPVEPEEAPNKAPSGGCSQTQSAGQPLPLVGPTLLAALALLGWRWRRREGDA